MHSNLHKLGLFDVPWKQFNKLLQSLVEMRTLHTAGTFYKRLIWRLQMWNSEIEFSFAVVTWQQASKHINQSIIGAIVSKYRSKCLVVSSEKEEKGRFCSS
jgi:hypothetical protein